MGLLELVNRGYLPPSLDVGVVVGSLPGKGREGDADTDSTADLRQHSAGVQWADTWRPVTVRDREEAKETLTAEAADTVAPTPASARNQATAPHSRQRSRPSRYASQPTEEEQKTQETRVQPHSARSRHDSTRSTASVPSIGGLHDSFTGALSHGELVAAARSYDSLLDDFSHHPLFVQGGRLVTDTPEFISFQRAYAGQWPALASLVGRVREFSEGVEGRGVLTFYGSALVALVDRGVLDPSRDELLACLAPFDLARLHEREEAERRQAEEARQDAAARLITATIRMYVQRKRYRVLLHRDTAARLIQRKWRRWRDLQAHRRFVAGRWQEKVERWKVVQQHWVAGYTQFAQRQRVHVHIPSLTLPAPQRHGLYPHLALHENQHLPRLCELTNPLISIVYLTAQPLPPDVQSYYVRLLEVGGVRDVPSRLDFLSPELAAFFSASHPFGLASLALYSGPRPAGGAGGNQREAGRDHPGRRGLQRLDAGGGAGPAPVLPRRGEEAPVGHGQRHSAAHLRLERPHPL